MEIEIIVFKKYNNWDEHSLEVTCYRFELAEESINDLKDRSIENIQFGQQQQERDRERDREIERQRDSKIFGKLFRRPICA